MNGLVFLHGEFYNPVDILRTKGKTRDLVPNSKKEEVENLSAIRKYLNSTTSNAPIHVVKREQGGGSQPEQGSIRNIISWLNKNGEVLRGKGRSSDRIRQIRYTPSYSPSSIFRRGVFHVNAPCGALLVIQQYSFLFTIFDIS